MANSKIFRKAQQRSSSGGSKLTGFVGFREAIEVIKDTQVRNVEPYGLLAAIAKNLKTKREDLYVKVLGADSRGIVKLMVSIGKNKDQAVNSKQFMVVGDIIKSEIVKIKEVATNASTRAQIEKNNRSSDDIEEKSKTANRGKSKSAVERKNSRNSRRRFRKVTKRSTLIQGRARTQGSRAKQVNLKRKVKLKNKVVVEDFTATGQIPASFNDSTANVPPQDFSSVYEDV